MTEKLEAVDFYSGHKETLTYLGTIWVPDGSPVALRAEKRFTCDAVPEGEMYVEADYLAAVKDLQTSPALPRSSKSWRHDYRNSLGTPWSYRFQTGAVQVYQFGHLVQTFYCNGGREPYQYFPNLGSSAVAR